MRIFNANQIQQIEQATFNHSSQRISQIEIMEEAGDVFSQYFMADYGVQQPVTIFCGTGNNGGDGLVIARILSAAGYDVSVVLLAIGKPTEAFTTMKSRLPNHDKINIYDLQEGEDIDKLFIELFQSADLDLLEPVIIDALFGLGLNRPIEGYWATVINRINQEGFDIVAVDLPSGLFADYATEGTAIQATSTISFLAPKLSFFFPENEQFLGRWIYAPLSFSEDVLEQTPSNLHIITPFDIVPPPPRKRFSHKGTFGSALIIGGQYGMAGAALLCTQAALRSGCGKVTVLSPSCNQTILQLGAPEAMLLATTSDRYLAMTPIFMTIYSAIGIGSGMGKHIETVKFLRKLLQSNRQLVLDADALNILSENRELLLELPKNTILTPHPKEFERLLGSTWDNGFERLDKQMAFSLKYNVFVIFKSANTCITTPNGNCYFNITGNPGMSKAGTGDILTGFLTGLLARGYEPLEACMTAVYHHGLAGDDVAEERGMESMKAGDLLEYLYSILLIAKKLYLSLKYNHETIFFSTFHIHLLPDSSARPSIYGWTHCRHECFSN